jgi:hypothetical protein
MFDGLLHLVTNADLIEMRSASPIDMTRVIFVDHTNLITVIRADLVRARAAIARQQPIAGIQA